MRVATCSSVMQERLCAVQTRQLAPHSRLQRSCKPVTYQPTLRKSLRWFRGTFWGAVAHVKCCTEPAYGRLRHRCAAPDARLFYTVDGSRPSASSLRCDGGTATVTLEATATVKTALSDARKRERRAVELGGALRRRVGDERRRAGG